MQDAHDPAICFGGCEKVHKSLIVQLRLGGGDKVDKDIAGLYGTAQHQMAEESFLSHLVIVGRSDGCKVLKDRLQNDHKIRVRNVTVL